MKVRVINFTEIGSIEAVVNFVSIWLMKPVICHTTQESLFDIIGFEPDKDIEILRTKGILVEVVVDTPKSQPSVDQIATKPPRPTTRWKRIRAFLGY